jgi:hypothetical protein
MVLHRHLIVVSLVTLATLAACTASAITGDDRASSAALQLKTPALVQCPTNETTSATAVVGPLGGLVNAGGTSIQIPAGALSSDATVTVTVPQSNFMEVDISVAGVDHFVFEQPVVVTLNYARCERNDISASPLSVWYIDSQSKDLLEQMPSVDDKLTQTITFTTGHLSGYAVAN